MQCDYFDAGRCRSCALMGVPYAEQLAAKQADCAGLLPRDVAWLDPCASAERGFRNKAKLAAGGRRGAPTLGILDADGHGVDLSDCGLYEPGLTDAVRRLPGVVAELGLTPYDVPTRAGELKHLLVTHSPDGELMVRFVLRSPGQVVRIREGLDRMKAALPGLRVVTVNLQPEHKAVLEGVEERALTATDTRPIDTRPIDTLPMRVNDLTLELGPRAFFQTNTAVGAALYRQVRAWVAQLRPALLWDLYCGVGGFALHALGHAGRVVGVEVSPDAVRSARAAAERSTDLPVHEWHTADATRWVAGQTQRPDLVVVNPPRRGLGPALAGWLQDAGPAHVVYSSCNAATLARDLAAMPGYAVTTARLFDMFPQTRHYEVLVRLERR